MSAAVFGLTALGGATLGPGGTPATSIGGSGSGGTVTPTRAVVAPSGSVHGRLRGWTLAPADGGVVRARNVGATPLTSSPIRAAAHLGLGGWVRMGG